MFWILLATARLCGCQNGWDIVYKFNIIAFHVFFPPSNIVYMHMQWKHEVDDSAWVMDKDIHAWKELFHLARFPCQVEVSPTRNCDIVSIRWAVHCTKSAGVVASTTDTTGYCSVTAMGIQRSLWCIEHQRLQGMIFLLGMLLSYYDHFLLN